MITEISDIRVWKDYYRNKQGVREGPSRSKGPMWGQHKGPTQGPKARGCLTRMKDMGTQCDHNHR